MEDTIVAISTALGVGAISIIRVSGPESISIVNEIFKGKDTFNQQKKNFQDDLKTAKYTTEIDALKIEYNEPQTSNKVQITPNYVTLYKPVETKDTSLYLINYENFCAF